MLNFIIFQLGWFLTVYWHNNYVATIGFILALLNFYWLPHRFHVTILVGVLISLLGCLNDYLLLKAHVLDFPQQSYYVLPLWLAALWLLLTSTFSKSLSWIFDLSLLQQGIYSGIGGAFSYIAGAEIGAIKYTLASIPEFVFHFVNWAVLLPILLRLHKYLYKLLT